MSPVTGASGTPALRGTQRELTKGSSLPRQKRGLPRAKRGAFQKKVCMPKFKINKITTPQKNSDSPTDSDSDQTLQRTEVIIKIAKSQGVDFGSGNAQERIRYFIKLGLLPHAIRKTPERFFSHGEKSPVGHLPFWVVKRLKKINNLAKNGLSFPQISEQLKAQKKTKDVPQNSQYKEPIVGGTSADGAAKSPSPKVVLVQKVGISKKDIS